MRTHSLNRRKWIAVTTAGGASLLDARLYCQTFAEAAKADAIVHLGSRRELFIDDAIIGSIGSAMLKYHKPEPREVVITCDEPWEGNTSAYYSIFQDDDRFRMFYRGSHFNEATKKGTHPEFVCYAESADGIHWKKPKLGIFEFNGSKENNIIWTGDGAHNFTPFKDHNPACSKESRYKALARVTQKIDGKNVVRLNAYQSPDGLHWSELAESVITDGAFDSQNLAFWDTERGEYRAYWRFFSERVRAIRTATSHDFVHWENQHDLVYADSPPEHLYTNAVMPYFRAPHISIGFPTRFQPKTQQVEPVFMSSRDGVHFHRSNEELIPITAPEDRDGNRSNYLTYGLLQLPGNDRELSVYATEAYYAGPGSRVRRFAFRTDGFRSLNATGQATITTKPLTFTGSKLSLNIVSAGQTRIEIQDTEGQALPGFSLDGSIPMSGDAVDHHAMWKNNPDLGKHAGQVIRLKFVLTDADLYSFQFKAHT
ncbi:MAG: hypothetical protein SGI77_24705 [Pirellulaceae bacterium]|nr:hypothetical protein [Pirellulaceae bacterium]